MLGPVKDDGNHHIETKGPPILTTVHRLDPQKYATAKGYYQVQMFPDDLRKTAIITFFGLFELVCMPFGLRVQLSSV